MTHFNEPSRRRSSPNDHRVEHRLHDELRRPIAAPDMTRTIMGKLGYMQASPAVVRRRKIRRVLDRAALLAVVIAVGSVGVMVFKSSPDARQPLESTMPAAVRHDVQHQQHRFNTVIQLLRDMPPRLEIEEVLETGLDVAEPLHLLDEDVDHSAVAPVRWI
jgi:hypothetical protein